MADDEKDLELRRNFKFRLLQNPNYFGNLSELKLPNLPGPVFEKIGDTTYEQLTCIGYNPDTDILTAIVRVNLGAGYSGGPCTDGSREYVRFYLDYGSGWVDHGAASFEIHDLGFPEPLCYAVSIKLGPKMRSCCDGKPVLPVVRGILSWNVEPPAGMPDWAPVWGNRLERAIQIEPRSPFLCRFFDRFTAEGVQKIDPVLMGKLKAALEAQPPAPKPTATLAELQAEPTDDKLHALRHIYPAVAKLAAGNSDIAAWQVLQAAKIDFSVFDDFILTPKFNTTYEELTCVGLDRDQSLLHGIVQIKRPSGYSGGLCSAGSREYIAFYLDFGSGWEYQGTTSVVVHDVPVPRGGLWYQASLPVNLDKHRMPWCETGRARIRGILSWATPPMPNQPEFVPHWGDREDCYIEIRPWPQGVQPGVPFLEAIGNMPVAQIAATGYASGASIGATFTADDSPFGGAILISGFLAMPASANLEYRVMVKAPSDPIFKPWTTTFTAALTTIIGTTITHSNVSQVATGDWFTYLPEAGPPVFVSVAGNLLARYTAGEEGLHRVFVQFRDPAVPMVVMSTAIHNFLVDNTPPVVDVEITSGTGNCSKFPTGGEPIVGTFSMSDVHSHSLTLSVTPHPESDPGDLAIITAVPAGPFLTLPKLGPGATNSLSYAAFTLDGSGTAGTWELNTAGMAACGYNIRIDGADRTIVNSGFIGWSAADIEGFCLFE